MILISVMSRVGLGRLTQLGGYESSMVQTFDLLSHSDKLCLENNLVLMAKGKGTGCQFSILRMKSCKQV